MSDRPILDGYISPLAPQTHLFPSKGIGVDRGGRFRENSWSNRATELAIERVLHQTRITLGEKETELGPEPKAHFITSLIIRMTEKVEIIFEEERARDFHRRVSPCHAKTALHSLAAMIGWDGNEGLNDNGPDLNSNWNRPIGSENERERHFGSTLSD